jgi:pimeloyl-ACP methyl ester carboxylesterase
VTGWRLILAACCALLVAAVPVTRPAPWQTIPPSPPMPPALASGMAPIDGISMYYALYGHGDPILLIHGGLGSADDWAGVIPALAARHRVIVADTRGHGRSTRTDAPFTYALLAADYLALLDYLKVPKVALVGWSDGAIIGLDIAITHPDRLTCLFAQAANATPSGLIARPADRHALTAAARLDADTYRRLSPTPGRYAAFRAALARMWETQPMFTTAQLGAIRVRTAIVLGDHDEVVSGTHTESLARAIPGARLIVLPDVSHFALLQDPAGYARAVLDFVDDR